ncbi:putative ABC transporter [Eremomyces bilateralis CBS 781.70]|uniref:ABC transporter n=1 Tax=Eremomyces bilateralis CBS 781.70 TaxID=1392243 RepID=A0A6G1GG71_9PEZI|nr:putative ABC transporter [Eremomyces bilateralis CBS 781.70]KAF1816860.1 putative ABC transporter [Eremomyces bilateralis CBS 781.70]
MRRPLSSSLLAAAALSLLPITFASAQQTFANFTSIDLRPRTVFDDRPEDCPPCFNCNLDDFTCHQFANCSKASGKCICPPGFGGDDCSTPLCGSLADRDRAPRAGDTCDCNDGWTGINCNLCKTDNACNAFMPEGKGGVCYQQGLMVKENYQMCDITNKKILQQLKGKVPQATFACNADREECNFQFWVDEKESFYCALDTCVWDVQMEANRNTTKYTCENISCACVPGRMLCGESGSVDIGEFLEESIKGPASFATIATEGGSKDDGSVFSEPAMNDLISSIFGDKSIFLSCNAGECLYKTEVPGYERPIKKINTPLIAGIIAGCALFVVAVILLVWYLTRRSAARGGYGPIHISDDEEDENARLLAGHNPAGLYFQNVSYRLNGKQILAGIEGAVHPGQLMAIMGASGAGKTTFLDILARKNKRGVVDGDIYVNGEFIPDDEFKSVIGFVDQEDTMLATLTVHETILDSAKLRLPREMSVQAKEQRVEDVERQLGIYHIRNQIIGSEEGQRGISGGEKRRVGIACELVTSPSILFLDEPTSGLDAYNAFNVVECLVNLVRNYNRTVVFTIHQPRSNIVALFDQLVLLARGRMVYSGPLPSCQSYFDSLGFSCPPGFNIADYLVDLTMHAGTPHTPIDEDSSLFAAPLGLRTSASSAIAVKSIPSVSNLSNHDDPSPASPSEERRSLLRPSEERQSLLRPKGKRRTSIRALQERQLFTRKKQRADDVASTPRTDDEGSMADPNEEPQQWLRLSKQHGLPPPQILDDPDHLPPPASGGTGTNLDMLVASFTSSDVAAALHEDIYAAIDSATAANTPTADGALTPNGSGLGYAKIKGFRKVGYLGQTAILSVRTWRNLYRNPMLMLTHYAIAIVLAVFLGFLFYGLTDDIKGFQNRLGLFFFLLALFGFSTLTTLTVFHPERLLFVRERAKGYYYPISYFTAKVIFDIVPLRLIPPLIMGAIVYPMTGLVPQWAEFLRFILFLVLFNLAAAAMCLFIGVIIHNPGVANLIGSLVMLFSLLFGGFLLNHETIPGALRWLQSLSIFHYGFEGLIVNEVVTLSLVDHKYGLDIEVPGAAILSSFGFNTQALWDDCIGLAVICGAFIVVTYLAMHVMLIEKR